jgi:hypothetical protein
LTRRNAHPGIVASGQRTQIGDAVSGGGHAARAIARAVTACTLLAGLFFMHGLFTPGCHAAEGMPPTPTPMVTAQAEAPAMMPDAGHPSALVLMAHDMGQDSLCVSTPPPKPINLADLLLALVTLGALTFAAFALSFSRWTVHSRQRPPPLAGSALLTTLCLSRT